MTNRNMHSLTELADVIRESDTILIFPHVQMDGDTLGSAVALCHGIRSMGKDAYIYIDEPIPANLRFLDHGVCTIDPNVLGKPDLCIAVDCSDETRIASRQTVFSSGQITASLDHHITFQPFGTYCYLDASSAASGEIVYRLLNELDVIIDVRMAEALFAAISTDTGNFTYSNASKETHQIVADLYDTGFDHNKVAVEIYQRVRREKVQLVSAVLSNMEFYADGKANLSAVSEQILKETGATMDESEGIVEQMRNIEGVEVSAILKEDHGIIKVGMRSKSTADVSIIAKGFGGGGHKRAAGFSLELSLEEAKARLKEAVKTHLDQLEKESNGNRRNH